MHVEAWWYGFSGVVLGLLLVLASFCTRMGQSHETYTKFVARFWAIGVLGVGGTIVALCAARGIHFEDKTLIAMLIALFMGCGLTVAAQFEPNTPRCR